MVRGRQVTLSFPPFTPAVIWLLGINTGIFLLFVLFGATLPGVVQFLFDNFALQPSAVLRGWVWEIVTYSFIHAGFWHWFTNMLGIWMFGSTLEGAWGRHRFLQLYSFGVIGAALTTILLSYTRALGSPDIPTVGASGGVFAILIAFGIVFGENEIMLIPFPFLIKAKYFVAILVLITVIFAISGGGNVAYLAHLGGLFFGYIYLKFMPRGGWQFSFSEGLYGIRNSYYRWRRRRAARKFEVYMREHNRTVMFDEHGNYIPPEESNKKDGGSKSGWVN